MEDLRTDRLWVLDTEHGGERPATHTEAAATIARLRAALTTCMVGGNHLGVIIGADHPPRTASHDEAMAHYGYGPIYEAWCCWRAIMQAREMAP